MPDITVSSDVHAMLQAGSNAGIRTAIGLGTLATQSGTFSGTSSGTNTGDQTTVSGNAGTATALATSRNINGVAFNGTADITVTAAAGTLSGATLAAGVTASSLTSVGTITTGVWQGTIIGPAYLGTGSSITTKFLRGDGTWQTIGGGGDALVSGSLDQFADVTQTGGATLAISSSTTLAGGTHSGTNTGDQTTISGNAGSATVLQTARNINGVAFDGSADITVTAAGSTLSDTVPASKGGTGLTALSANIVSTLGAADYSAAKTLWSLNNVDNTSNATERAASATLTNKTISTGCVIPWEIQLAASDETTALTTGTGKVTFRMPWAATLTSVVASVTTAPTGSTLVVDINEAGTTLLSTKLSIDASEKTSTTAATAAVISDSALAADAEITIDIDQVGSTVAGAGLKILLRGTRTI